MQKNRKNLIENTKKTFGKSLKEFVVGSKIIHWPGKTITESDNNIFSLITMNHHPLHLDKIQSSSPMRCARRISLGERPNDKVWQL